MSSLYYVNCLNHLICRTNSVSHRLKVAGRLAALSNVDHSISTAKLNHILHKKHCIMEK